MYDKVTESFGENCDQSDSCGGLKVKRAQTAGLENTGLAMQEKRKEDRREMACRGGGASGFADPPPKKKVILGKGGEQKKWGESAVSA